MKTLITAAITLGLIGFVCPLVVANNSGPKLGDYNADLSPPDLTAFSLLGSNGNAVSRPGSVSELVIAFLNVGVQGDKISPNVAVEWTPMRTFAARSIEAYKKQRWWRATQLSFATNRDMLGTGMAIGLRWVPIDKSDPVTGDAVLDKEVKNTVRQYDVLTREVRITLDFQNTRLRALADSLGKTDEERIGIQLVLTGALPLVDSSDEQTVAALYRRVIDSLDSKGMGESILTSDQKDTIRAVCGEYVLLFDLPRAEIAESVNKAVNLAKARFKKRSWNATVSHFAGGWVWRSADDTWKGLDFDYFRVYGGLALRLTRFGQAIVQADYDDFSESDSLRKQAWSLGGRFLIGGSDLRATGEGMWRKVIGRGGQPDGETWRFMVGVEARLRKELWLEVGIGNEAPSGDIAEGSILTLANLKYSLNPSARTKLPISN